MDKKWYTVRVQTGKEDILKNILDKRIKANVLDASISRVLVPTEKVSEIKGGKKRVLEKKLYPGYLMIEMELTDETKAAILETPGIGDFVGGSETPSPLAQHEVEKMLRLEKAVESDEKPIVKVPFKKGDTVRIKEGPFENFEGSVEEIVPTKGIVRVIITIFNRPTEVEMEYWQVEAV